jgi:nephrocystin-3
MKTSSRTVRVFLSSTFRDFAEERDLLVRKVFPELRRKCRERQVELVDVDLRWGITEKEAQQGKVLPICLAEIDRARPFFLGLIGERYGWIPASDQYDPSILQEQPWLEEHRGGKSVTELEILHGVLNNPEMAGRAYFYFRDSKWAKRKGGDYLAGTDDEREKLVALKERIRKSQFPVVKNYKNPQSLAERIKDDLWNIIDKAYPVDEVPDALTQERMVHEAYAETRRRLYLGGEGYIAKLNDAMKARDFRPVLITGQSGGGKSALLANWVTSWSKKNKKAAVIVHHLGAGSDAADPIRLAVRLMQEISRITGDVFKPESDPDKQLEKLPEWLAMASSWSQRTKSELLIVLDGVDKVSERQRLRWFPRFLPPKVKLVASCLYGDILEEVKGRLNWQELKVQPFTKTEQKSFIGKYLGRYGKTLTSKQTKALQTHFLSGNPLFLLTVLEELRVFGVHTQLEKRLDELLSPPLGKTHGQMPAVDDVFEHVLARMEKDLGKKAVQRAMEAIWASRTGLYQDELLAIAKLSPAKWASMQNALDESIYMSSSKISFGHDYLRKAVANRYRLSGKSLLRTHRILAQWFAGREIDPRVLEELPWQYCHGKNSISLRNWLKNRTNFLMLLNQAQGIADARKYWNTLGGKKNVSDYVDLILTLTMESSNLRSIDKILEFIDYCGWDCVGLTAIEKVWPFVENQIKSDFFESIMARRVKILIKNGYYEKASDSIEERRNGKFTEIDPLLQIAEGNLCCLIDDPKYVIARCSKALEEIIEGRNMYSNRKVIRAKLDFSKMLFSCNDLAPMGWELLDKCMIESENYFGDLDPMSIEIRISIGHACMNHGDFIEAEKFFREAYIRCVNSYGADSINAHCCESALGAALAEFEETKYVGRDITYKCANLIEKYYGIKHLDTSYAYENLARAEAACGFYDKASRYAAISLSVMKEIMAPSHPRILRASYNLARYECHEGNLDGAKILLGSNLELEWDPSTKNQALADPDFASIRDWINAQ